MTNETTEQEAAEREEPAPLLPYGFTAVQLHAIRRQAAQLIDAPEASLVRAEGRVIVHGDPRRTATLLFRLVGTKEGVCLVWEDGRNKAIWLYERHVTRCGTAV